MLVSNQPDLVEAEVKLKQLFSTNDPRLSDQLYYHYTPINLAAAWEMTAGDPGIVVQVL